MSDDSDDSGADTILDQPTSRYKTPFERYHGSDDEFDRRPTYRRRGSNDEFDKHPTYRVREAYGPITQPLAFSQSVRETRRHGYLDLEQYNPAGKTPLVEENPPSDRPAWKNPLSQSVTEYQASGPYCKMKRWCSMDSGDSEVEANRKNFPLGGSIKRKLRRKSTKRADKIDEAYGIDTEEYERVRLRVMKEPAVVNAVEALQERWRMIMYMYHDCVDLNEGRKERQHKKLTVKRQLELICVVSAFIAMCIPITVIMVAVCR